jgi:hypothetical protein
MQPIHMNIVPPSRRRIMVRCFALIALLTIMIDTAPRSSVTSPLQDRLRPALNVIGLWQGEWPLFAPNPTINNGWLSAEFYPVGGKLPLMEPNGKPLSWNSPIWSEYSAWSKFYRFRHVNYFTRVQYRGKDPLDDLSDFIARKMLGPEYHFVETRTNPASSEDDPSSVELRLSKSAVQIIMPEDGSLPARDEATWIYVGSGLGMRKYAK